MFQIAIPVISVSEIKKTKTAILVPNALIIATAQERVSWILFIFFLSDKQPFNEDFIVFTVCFCVITVPRHSIQGVDVSVLPFGSECLKPVFPLNVIYCYLL